MPANMQATASTPISTPTPKPKRYHPAMVVLHWIIVLLIIAAALLAMGGGEGRRSGGVTIAGLPILSVHMILGITVLVLLVVRLVIRWRTQRPDWLQLEVLFWIRSVN
jgi:cytochrome b561